MVTALIGPSGCGKSTFLRILNRMHEVTPGAELAGTVHLDGVEIYGPTQRATETRFQIGMVFQKPNPVPGDVDLRQRAVGPALQSHPSPQRRRSRRGDADKGRASGTRFATVSSLSVESSQAASSSGSASRGPSRCRPSVLLMDEPCSALDPTSTRRIEETIRDIADEVTVVIVTHNMQQAHRVSQNCAFFLAGENEPGRLVESGPTERIFSDPSDPRTSDYVNGRFG